MSHSHDLVVVGAGSAGLAAAAFAVRMGLSVALAEAHRIGGDCTWTGCVPSKALLHAAHVAHEMRHADRVGLVPCPVEPDLGRVMSVVQAARERVYRLETPEALRREGIDVALGPTTFRDERTLDVGGRMLRGKFFLLCTGAVPAVPPLPGLADGPYLTNHDVFELAELPARLCVLGGGPVGVELAQAFHRLGSQVTIVGRNQRLLPSADPEASEILAAALRAEGLTLHTGAAVERVERDGTTRVVARDRERVISIECDQILVALGRKPNVTGLGLDKAGVLHDERRIVVDARLRTSQKHVYAAGDAVGSFQFTHYAGWQAVLAVRNMFLPGSTPALLPSVPWALFTEPEVAQVGQTEAQARAQGRRVTVQRLAIERNDRAQTAGEGTGLMKIVLGPRGTILGATIVGTAAGELINELTVAMDNGVRLARLAASIHAYPTYGFALQLAAAEAFKEKLSTGLLGAIVRRLAKMAR